MGSSLPSLASSYTLFDDKVEEGEEERWEEEDMPDFPSLPEAGPLTKDNSPYYQEINVHLQKAARKKGIALLPASLLFTEKDKKETIHSIKNLILIFEEGSHRFPTLYANAKNHGHAARYIAVSVVSAGVYPLIDGLTTSLLRKSFRKTKKKYFSFHELYLKWCELQLYYEIKNHLRGEGTVQATLPPLTF